MKRQLFDKAVTNALLVVLISTAVALPAIAGGSGSYSLGMHQAQKAIKDGDLAEAEKILDELSKLNAKDFELLELRGRVLFWQKRYAESIMSFQAAKRIHPSADVDRELQRVETAQQLAEAESLVARKDETQAQALLRRQFDTGRDPYRVGLALVQIQMKRAEYSEAHVVLTRMLQLFPHERDLVLLKTQALLGSGQPGDALSFLTQRGETSGDAELLAFRARALMRLQRFEEARQNFTESLSLRDDPQVRLEKERAETAEALRHIDGLLEQGQQAQAVSLLTGQLQAGRDSYGTGIRLANLYTRMNRHEDAAKVYLQLTQQYPQDLELVELYARSLINAGHMDEALRFLETLYSGEDRSELAALRGKILFLQRRYPEAREEYQKAVNLGASMQKLQAELDVVQMELDFQRYLSFLHAKDTQAAHPLLETVAQGPYGREARMMYARALTNERRYEAALEPSRILYSEYPADAEVAVLYADTLLLAGERREAQGVLERLSLQGRESLMRDRDDLFYRARGNWVKLFGAAYNYSRGSDSEHSTGITASQHLHRVTLVGSALETTRFDKTDPQLALDLYLGRRPGENYYGNLSFTFSPGANFLPQNSIGIEVARSLSPVELSLGYTRLNFSGRDANILTTSLLCYLPRTSVILGEKLYIVPSSSTLMSVTSLRWQPNHHLFAFGAVGLGNSSERIESGSDQELRRYDTWSLRGGGEYRFTPAVSLGGEVSFESRRNLYDRSGVSLFIKHWWP